MKILKILKEIDSDFDLNPFYLIYLTDTHLVHHLQLHARPELRADRRPQLRVEVDGQRPGAGQPLHQELAPVRVLAHDRCKKLRL